MAALVKVNSLEAYALLNTRSTTVSVTHDFAHVVSLDVQQLENPVVLQLGTVGSRSMINYGARTHIKFGSITEENTYVNVVNIDRYDMIIRTPFMWRHRFVLDFDKNTLSTRPWGHTIPTLTSGQEDLMLAKKWASHTCMPAVLDGLAAHTSHWIAPSVVGPSHEKLPRSQGKTNPFPEGGDEKHIQVMDTNRICIDNNLSKPPVNLQVLCEQWFAKYADILNGAPAELLPLREINHRISLIDEKKHYHYHLPQCPEAMKLQLLEKLRHYADVGWWRPRIVLQAAPLLCIPKKTGKIRTVIDCHQWNDNTIKDVTPFPDQDQIRMDVAWGRYCSKINLSNAYKQVQIKPEDVPKTAFVTVFGTYESAVMQQGDCNTPAMFLRLITAIFHDEISIYLHTYLNDLFIFSDMLEDHNKHLDAVLNKLCENRLFLEHAKCDLYLQCMDCLGHLIDDHGLHADADKMAHIWNWHMPRSHKDVQRFLGLVQYLAHFMPDVTAYTSLLSAICRNGQPFYWKPLHKACFTNIKTIMCRSPILSPINPMLDDPIWVIYDTLMSGIGTIYRQGETWQTCRPASFMSRKFTTAQMNYRVFEMETITILEALLKWEDKLLSQKIRIVMDHKALEFFKTQQHLNSRQACWMEFLACFDFDIIYVRGETNLVADLLSRYHKSDHWDESYDTSQYVNADTWLDPKGEELPWDHFEESRAMWDSNCPQCQCRALHWADESISCAPKHHIVKGIETRQHKAAELVANKESGQEPPIHQCMPLQDQADPTISESLGQLPDLRSRVEGDRSILKHLKEGYTKDLVLVKVLKNSEHHKNFKIVDGFIYTCNCAEDSVLCIPSVVAEKCRLTEVIIAQAHETLGHFGLQKTADHICRHYWWPRIRPDIKQYCKMCPICQTTKSSAQRVPGLLHSLPIPMCP
jgi:RNase H-like domain found in reverse transcriptase/Integrase zinc binding domain/Reverse transcriptase (RNA-dependent DNA polymerase)